MRRDLADSLERQAFLMGALWVNSRITGALLRASLKNRDISAQDAQRVGQQCPRNEKPAQTSESEAGLNTKQCEEIMTQSSIPAQELVKRLCDDRKIRGTRPLEERKRASLLRSVVDQLSIIRDCGNKNLHGWELDIDGEGDL